MMHTVEDEGMMRWRQMVGGKGTIHVSTEYTDRDQNVGENYWIT